ncbi:AhpC/TSA family protein [Lentimicrobium sp. L6]|uniref:TlpA disulfide reductase family protein n=1 Tax=Lentimicrobium sp. L6 TaxID=2735916 RepID=UPI001555BA9B|nr:TlpA disulfide reductase family protein [Lentimicrobium sp. L6]NPD83151.1 AhpC/TSA family protein [Lentimicrobium sp. L6]
MKNIKYLMLFAIALGIFSACENEAKQKQESYEIAGEFRGVTEGNAFIKVRGENGWETIDSAIIVEEKFNMSGSTEDVKFVYLVSDAYRGGIPLFLENTAYSINLHKDSIDKVEIKGSEIQAAFAEAKTNMDKYDELWQDYYYNEYRAMTDEEKAKNEDHLNDLYDGAQLLKKEYIKSFITKNADNIAAAQILMDSEDALGTDDMLTLYEGLTPLVKSSNPGIFLTERIEIVKKTAIGQPLIDFTMNDTKGNPLKLSEITKGKYVLVDFWAAWCGPCRKENPNVVENYNKYNADGFDVLGVSFDDDKDKWLKAIEDDGLTWTQVSDLKGWKNSAGKLYGIRSIPQNILLSPEGIILEKNLRDKALGEKLAEIFGK